MEIIDIRCRQQFSSPDLDFIATVLGHEKSELSVNQLLEDKYNDALFRLQDQAMQFSNRNDVSQIYSHRVF